MKRVGVCLSLLVLLAAAASAKEEPRSPWVLHWDVLGRHNPSEIFSVFGVNRRHTFARTLSRYRDGAYLQGGATAGLGPAYSRGSLVGEWAPFSQVRFRSSYDLYGFFGTNSGLLSFDTEGDDFGTSGRDRRAGREEAETGQRFFIQAQLREQYERLIVINEIEMAWYSMNGNGPFFLDLEYDTLIRRNDVILADRTFFLYEFRRESESVGLWAGLYHEFVNPRGTFLERQRVGAAFRWVPSRRGWGLDRPRVYGRAGYNVKDRNRNGQFFFEGGVGADFDWY